MGSRIYVGNLSWDTNEDTLRGAFEADGRNVKEVSIVTDRDTGRPRVLTASPTGTFAAL